MNGERNGGGDIGSLSSVLNQLELSKTLCELGIMTIMSNPEDPDADPQDPDEDQPRKVGGIQPDDHPER